MSTISFPEEPGMKTGLYKRLREMLVPVRVHSLPASHGPDVLSQTRAPTPESRPADVDTAVSEHRNYQPHSPRGC